ncbi:MAG: Gfo/Idh/MocA family oxidoreductase [Bacteroidales bacterium]|nr:MAG: Gfo/Idh/MocA family oxidoreductase [Bacteroidales bacterium]
MSKEDFKNKLNRRRFIKGIIALPVIGGLTYAGIRKYNYLTDWLRRKKALELIGLDKEQKELASVFFGKSTGNHIRLGVIGMGRRGKALLRTCGFYNKEWIERNKEEPSLEAFYNQDDLNVSITGICDVFDLHAEEGINISKNPLYESGKLGKVKRYKRYTDLLASSEVDAVIITTPDHWHAQMSIDAAKAGKHVYCEKCMTRTEQETVEVYNAIKNSNIIFQVGHQNRQHGTMIMAKNIINKGILGKISSIETFTNRNSPDGAWIRHDGKPGDAKSIDWEQFLGNSPKVPFDVKRFYNWSQYWDYATGLSGQLFSHEYDAINQILNIGIPKAAVASGGIYHYKDDRDIPDVFHAVFEYPQHDFTLTYDATLLNSAIRNKIILGSDAIMEIGQDLKIKIDRKSKKHDSLIKNNMIEPSSDIFLFDSQTNEVDAITSATQQYYASRGLTYTIKDGKLIDSVHLHIRDWLYHIRNGGQPACNIDLGFEGAITCHMATKAYREKRRVEWNPVTRKIV